MWNKLYSFWRAYTSELHEIIQDADSMLWFSLLLMSLVGFISDINIFDDLFEGNTIFPGKLLLKILLLLFVGGSTLYALGATFGKALWLVRKKYYTKEITVNNICKKLSIYQGDYIENMQSICKSSNRNVYIIIPTCVDPLNVLINHLRNTPNTPFNWDNVKDYYTSLSETLLYGKNQPYVNIIRSNLENYVRTQLNANLSFLFQHKTVLLIPVHGDLNLHILLYINTRYPVNDPRRELWDGIETINEIFHTIRDIKTENTTVLMPAIHTGKTGDLHYVTSIIEILNQYMRLCNPNKPNEDYRPEELILCIRKKDMKNQNVSEYQIKSLISQMRKMYRI